MEQIPAGEAERTMKVQGVIFRAMAKKITWWEAAEILGVSPRTIRRWKWDYETHVPALVGRFFSSRFAWLASEARNPFWVASLQLAVCVRAR